MWSNRLPIHKGAHLFTCAREAGLSFKDSDTIISTLSHVDTRGILHRNSEEALRLGATCAPFFVTESDGCIVAFDSFHDFQQSILSS
ncbi:hypothetical protein KIN20_004655 [Parelaphostrongylus tenuis]|uniref:Uncharacterized protein n=1 Tax=Parelaphostrongylus tenuis TaxID=148309 RepID=A0AAD5MRP6_PARTN|nr:hypothetical protein KIN20_004655 [Parelaphostrongylus tenuis]